MSDGSDLSTAVAELEGGAVTATLLSHGLQNLARLMEYAGAPEVALRTEAIDIPALLALPPSRPGRCLPNCMRQSTFLVLPVVQQARTASERCPSVNERVKRRRSPHVEPFHRRASLVMQ